MAVKTVADLFLHELSDTCSAEKQMTRSLPKMARPDADEQLAQAFLDHLEETRGQVEHAIPSLPCEAVQTSPHVIHPKVKPARLNWKVSKTHTGSELSYRNRNRKHLITLAGRQIRILAV